LLRLPLGYRLRFVVRWRTHYLLLDAQGQKRKAWEICRVKLLLIASRAYAFLL
jgi:hypothetical protein